MGFMNALIRAESSDSALSKMEEYLRTFDWSVIEVEECRLIEEGFAFDDEGMQGMLDQARENEQAIILGTFHAYKAN